MGKISAAQKQDLTSFTLNLKMLITREEQNLYSLFVAFLVGAHLFFRIPKSLHIDESLQYQYTSMSLKGAIEGSYGQNQPPLGNLIQYLFGLLISPTNFTLRVPSILLGILISVLIQRILRKYIGQVHSTLLTLLIFLNPIVFTYFRYSRSYALCLFLIVIFIFLTLNYEKPVPNFLLLVACLIPWSRTVEGAVATVLFWLFFIALRGKELPLKKIIFWTGLVLISLISSLRLSLRTGNNYKSALDFNEVITNAIPRVKMILELGDGEFSILDSISALAILVSVLLLTLTKKRALVCLYLTYLLFSIFSPLLILSTSVIPLFPRYLFFYAIIYAANLYLMIFFISRIASKTLMPILITSLFIFSFSLQDLSRSPFPPFFEVAEFIDSNPTKNTLAFLPGDFNQFMAGWPMQAGLGYGTNWISTVVRDGGKIPEVIFIFPYVDLSYEVTKPYLPRTDRLTPIQNFGGELGVINLDSDMYVKLRVLSETDFHGSQLWFALLGLRIAHTQMDNIQISEWLERVCNSSEKLVNPGTLFGEFSSPQISINNFLVKSGLPSCQPF